MYASMTADAAADAYAADEGRREAEQDHEFTRAVHRVSESLTGEDMLDALIGCGDVIELLAARGEAELIGQIVMAVREDYTKAVAAQMVYPNQPCSDPVASMQRVLDASGKVLPRRVGDRWDWTGITQRPGAGLPLASDQRPALASICPVPAFPSLRGGL